MTVSIPALNAALKKTYGDGIDRINRLHARFAEVVRIEFKDMGWYDISATQALMLFNLGPGTEMTHGDILRGFYYGTNPSYNLNALVKGGYLASRIVAEDRRRKLVKLTPKGEEVAEVVSEMLDRHVGSLLAFGLNPARLDELNATLGRLERFWHDASAYRL